MTYVAILMMSYSGSCIVVGTNITLFTIFLHIFYSQKDSFLPILTKVYVCYGL